MKQKSKIILWYFGDNISGSSGKVGKSATAKGQAHHWQLDWLILTLTFDIFRIMLATIESRGYQRHLSCWCCYLSLGSKHFVKHHRRDITMPYHDDVTFKTLRVSEILSPTCKTTFWGLPGGRWLPYGCLVDCITSQHSLSVLYVVSIFREPRGKASLSS